MSALMFVPRAAPKLASKCSARARVKAVAKAGSAAYMRSMRLTKSTDGSGKLDGAQVSITPEPRSTKGTVVLSAKPLFCCAPSARPNQPVVSS